MSVIITDGRTGTTYAGSADRLGFNPYTLRDDYRFSAVSAGGVIIWGTYDITIASMEIGVASGVYDLTNIVIDGTGGWDTGTPTDYPTIEPPFVDSPPDPGVDNPIYYGVLWPLTPGIDPARLQSLLTQVTHRHGGFA